MSRLLRWLALALPAFGAVVLTTMPVAAEAKPPVWLATVDPATGDDESYFKIVTSGGCPAPATNVLGKVYGFGLPASGEVVVGNTSAGVSPYQPIVAPLGVTMREVVFEQKDLFRLAGSYRLVLSCRTASDVRSYGDYVAAITFSTPTQWRVDPPQSSVKGPVVARPAQGPAGATSIPGLQDPQAGTPGRPEGAQPGGALSAAQAPGQSSPGPDAAARRTTDNGNAQRWPAFLVTALLLLGVVGYLRRRRSTTETTLHPTDLEMTGAGR